VREHLLQVLAEPQRAAESGHPHSARQPPPSACE
jgi:hypothetical protein